MESKMNYIEEYLDEVKKDEIGRDYSLKEWLEDNHHIFFLFQDNLYQMWHFVEKGIPYWQVNVHSKNDGDFIEEVKTWDSFDKAMSDPIFDGKNFSDVFDQIKMLY